MTNKIVYILVGILLMGLYSCQDQTKVYEEFVNVGGRNYPGAVQEPFVTPGKNRVIISAKVPTDPYVKEIRIFWNFYADSVTAQIDRSQEFLNIEINDLAEGERSFIIRTYDNDGNISVPVEVHGTVYGDNYQKRISNRVLDGAMLSNSGKLVLNFGDADLTNGAIGNVISYINLNDIETVVQIPIDQTELIIDDFKFDAKFSTTFLPDTACLDTFYTDDFVVNSFLIDFNDWTLINYSSQHTDGPNAAVNMIDGTYETRWHTKAGGSPLRTYPHWIAVDMGAVREINRFELARTTAYEPGGDLRGPNKFRILVNNEPDPDWENWTEVGAWDFNRLLGGWQAYYLDEPVSARYFIFVATEGPEYYMVMGAIRAF